MYFTTRLVMHDHTLLCKHGCCPSLAGAYHISTNLSSLSEREIDVCTGPVLLCSQYINSVITCGYNIVADIDRGKYEGVSIAFGLCQLIGSSSSSYSS